MDASRGSKLSRLREEKWKFDKHRSISPQIKQFIDDAAADYRRKRHSGHVLVPKDGPVLCELVEISKAVPRKEKGVDRPSQGRGISNSKQIETVEENVRLKK